MKDGWKKVTKDRPCKICTKPDPCAESTDGAVAMCNRVSQGAFKTSDDGGWFFHRLKESPEREIIRQRWAQARNGTPAPRPSSPATPAAKDWKAEAERFRAQLTPDLLARLAESTSVPVAAWEKLQPGWATQSDLREMHASGAGWADDYPDGAFVFPEHFGDGRVVGLSLRAVDGRKGAPAGAKRGLIVPADLHNLSGDVLIVEGASDVAAGCAVGLRCVGRPSNRSGAEDLAMMLDSLPVLVLGENDGKPGGAWPGRDGAKAVATQMAGRLNEVVKYALPPVGSKDIRAWWQGNVAGGLNPADAAAMKAAGVELLDVLRNASREAKPEKRTQADHLMDLAKAEFRLGISVDGEAFAVPLGGPAVAIMLKSGTSGLRGMLAKRYRAMTGKTPGAGALSDALAALEGMAQDCTPEPLFLRAARHDGGVVLDLGDTSGRVVIVTPAGWKLEAVSPVLFRRTALTGPMPEPVPAEAAELVELRKLMNVDDDSWPLVVGYLVAGLVSSIPHPVAMTDGEQGVGKSFAARMLVQLIDPSGAPLRSPPRDPEQWAMTAAGSWVVCLDNVSTVSAWLSDALCKASTGDGLVRRKLYSDSDLSVLSFRRVVLLTSIEAGGLRGDLADRLLRITLNRIPGNQRRREEELLAEYEATRPRLLGALLTALAKTLAALPGVKLATMPRMADFATILAALDTACPELTGGRALQLFEEQGGRNAREVVESDVVAAAVVRFMEHRDEWDGAASEMLFALTPAAPPKGWPGSARALTARLTRLRPALSAIGIEHTPPAEADHTRTHRLVKTAPPEPAEELDEADLDGIQFP